MGDAVDRLARVRDGRHHGAMKPQHRPKISRQSSWFFDKDDPDANERFGHRDAFLERRFIVSSEAVEMTAARGVDALVRPRQYRQVLGRFLRRDPPAERHAA